MAQLDPIVGDIDGNTKAILAAIEEAERAEVDLLVTPELAVLGYPPRDLVLRQGVAERSAAAVDRIARACRRTVALVGFVAPSPEGSAGSRPCQNAVAVCRAGRVERVYAKRLLPTYDVFDEDRYFTPGHEPVVIDVANERVAVLVCEDLWRADDVIGGRTYQVDPVVDSIVLGATTLAVLSASPFVSGKDVRHRERLYGLAARGVNVIAVNQVGANDDLIFDGRSRVIAGGGHLAGLGPAFQPANVIVDLGQPAAADEAVLDPDGERVDAIVAGIRGYLRKTGHREVVLGLSGGIDSALVATLATIAIGGSNVTGVLLPSRYSSQGSIDDALLSAKRLGLKAAPLVPIEAAHQALRQSLEIDDLRSVLPAGVAGLTDENLQSRIRGVLLMAISNATGALVLTTGNKSEIAAGYATLYGDMNGGLAPIGDLVKTKVYAMSRWLNVHFAQYGFSAPPIPAASIEKVPSAELRPNQTDQDSLPPYEVLDAIVEGRIEREESIDDIARRTSIDRPTVARWSLVIDRMQFKRDQGAVILKLTPRAFGRGRPMPIAGRSGGES